MRHGIARALQLYEPELRTELKVAGLLTRDSRIVERKKPGRWAALPFFKCSILRRLEGSSLVGMLCI